jgi:hypothetical protein
VYAAAGHGHLRAQNTHLGIADTATEPASTATLIGGSGLHKDLMVGFLAFTIRRGMAAR